jgi:hypothetical protein
MSDTPRESLAIDALLRKIRDDRSLPAEGEHFRSRVWQVITALPVNDQGLTLGRVHDILWESESAYAQPLNEAISRYCYDTAMSTSDHFNCEKQLLNEDPAEIWNHIYYGLQSLPELLKDCPELKGWEVPQFKRSLKDELVKAAASVCAEYNLTFNAVVNNKERGR